MCRCAGAALALAHHSITGAGFEPGSSGDLATARARYIQADGIHPNAEGVDAIVEAFGPRVLELVEAATP